MIRNLTTIYIIYQLAKKCFWLLLAITHNLLGVMVYLLLLLIIIIILNLLLGLVIELSNICL